MALTELQRPTKVDLYRNLQHAATEINNIMRRWESLAEFIATIESSDLDAMGVPTGQVRTDMQEFRTAINELISFFNDTSTTQTNAPETVISKIRKMS